MLVIFHINRLGHCPYDQYRGFIVIAKNKQEAIALCRHYATHDDDGDYMDWMEESVEWLEIEREITIIGDARPNQKEGVILADFRNG